MKHTLGRPGTDSSHGLEVPVWLTDDYLESYVRWREECVNVRAAYEQWSAARQNRATAFAAYGAALDREEHAARVIRERAERVRQSFA